MHRSEAVSSGGAGGLAALVEREMAALVGATPCPCPTALPAGSPPRQGRRSVHPCCDESLAADARFSVWGSHPAGPHRLAELTPGIAPL